MGAFERLRDRQSLSLFAGLGVLLLILIALRLSGARFSTPDSSSWLNRLTWVVDAAAVVAIWIGYRKMLRRLETLAGQMSEEILNRVVNFCTAMVFLFYLSLLRAVG